MMRISMKLLFLSLLIGCMVALLATNRVQAQMRNPTIAQRTWKQSWVEFRRFVDVAPFTIGTTGSKQLIFNAHGATSEWLVDIIRAGSSDDTLLYEYQAGQSSVSFTVDQPGTYNMTFAKAGASTGDGKLVHIDYSLVDANTSVQSPPPVKTVWKQSWVEFRRFVDVAPFTIGTTGSKQLIFNVHGATSEWLVDIVREGSSDDTLLYEYQAGESSVSFTVAQPGTYNMTFAKAGASTGDGKLVHIDYSLEDA